MDTSAFGEVEHWNWAIRTDALSRLSSPVPKIGIQASPFVAKVAL